MLIPMIQGGITLAGGFVIAGSGLFNGTNGTLTKTFAAGNTKIFTISTVVKFNSATGTIFFGGTNFSNNFDILQFSSGMLDFQMYHSSAAKGRLRTTQLIRDFSAYYHIIVAVNTNTAIAAANRLRMYINGIEVTDFETRTNPANNQVFLMNSAISHSIGAGIGNYFAPMYMANFTFIDGLQLTPTSFGETTNDGFWQINNPSGLTFGTNGFLIEGGVNVAAGTDSSYTEPTYAPVPVTFDGTNDQLNTGGADLTGSTDGANLFIAFWVKRKGGAGSAQQVILNHNGYIQTFFHTDNRYTVTAYNAAGAKICHMASGAVLVDNNWHHIMCSTNGSTQHMYLDGVSSLTTTTNTNDNIDFTRPGYFIGTTAAGAIQLQADLADLFFDDTYLDLSNSSNRAKLISATGEPVDPSSNGSTPFGASPLIYLNSNALATWHQNSGTGGGFTEVGALTAGSTVRGTGANDFLPTAITATKDSPTNGDA